MTTSESKTQNGNDILAATEPVEQLVRKGIEKHWKDDDILTTAEAAEVVRQSVATLRAYRLRGDIKLPYIRRGRGPRAPAGYKYSDLMLFLESRTFNNTTQETEAARQSKGN